MADKKHVAMLNKGVRAWNEWRVNNPAIKPDLQGITLYDDLSGINFSETYLVEADICDVNLRWANLREASLEQSSISDVDLSDADLAGASLTLIDSIDGMDMSRANLTGAKLWGTIFRKVNFSGTNFCESKMNGTVFLGIDLSSAIGLEKVRHLGPSSLDIETIYRSRGDIPLAFLRGAGIPDNFIEYLGSFTKKEFEYYSCFISYSNHDQHFVERLYADLQSNGVRCWFAPHDVQGGKKLNEQIEDAIRFHERLLLILSPHSIISDWVKIEIAKALRREIREKKQVLFPVRVGISFEQLKDWEYFDADIGKSSAREIREYYIPDFSNWKSHDSYQEEFAKLLRDLKKADESHAAGA